MTNHSDRPSESRVVVDDGARHANKHGSGVRDPIYDPCSLQHPPPGVKFSPALKRKARALMLSPEEANDE